MQEQGYEQLTLFQVVSPASPLAWLESRREKGTTVICGLKCCGLSESLARVGSSVRTYLESCELPLPTLSRTWSAKVIESSCWILKLRLSERRTGGNESRLWPTATVCGNNQRPDCGPKAGTGLATAVRMWPTPDTQNHRDGTKTRKEAHGAHAMSLHHAVAQAGNPSLAMAARLIPTPTARDYKDGSANACRNVPVNGLLGRAVHFLPTPRAQSANGTGKSRIGHREDLQTHAAKTTQEDNRTEARNGQLNPTWVEALMGFPIGWTSLED